MSRQSGLVKEFLLFAHQNRCGASGKYVGFLYIQGLCLVLCNKVMGEFCRGIYQSMPLLATSWWWQGNGNVGGGRITHNEEIPVVFYVQGFVLITTEAIGQKVI